MLRATLRKTIARETESLRKFQRWAKRLLHRLATSGLGLRRNDFRIRVRDSTSVRDGLVSLPELPYIARALGSRCARRATGRPYEIDRQATTRPATRSYEAIWDNLRLLVDAEKGPLSCPISAVLGSTCTLRIARMPGSSRRGSCRN